MKKFVSNKGKMDINKLAMSVTKKVTSFSEPMHSGKSTLVLTKASKADDFIVKLLQSLNEMNEDKEVLLTQFGIVPINSTQVVGKFEVHLMLET